MIERNWKKAYDKDFNQNGQSKAVEHTGLTVAQKHWLVRAWTFVFGEVPNAMPEEEADKPEPQRARGKRNWHHIYPQGASIRLTANDPDRPENIVPLDEFNHIGRGLVGEADENSPIIHMDSAWADKNYHPDNGEPTSYQRLSKVRAQRTDRGREYHNKGYDGFFSWLAGLVVSKYSQEFPDDKFPQRPTHRKGIKIWSEELMSWVEKD